MAGFFIGQQTKDMDRDNIEVEKVKVLVIIPAFNESENIEKVIQSLRQKVPEVDYLVINDCSRDNTLEILEGMHANYIDLPVNLGIGGAVQTGYIYALEKGYDIAIQMDGDGQHNPEYIPKLIEPLVKDECDTVIGSRFIEKEGFQSSLLRRMGINFLSTMVKLVSGVRVFDVTSGFRAVNRKGIELFAREYAQDYPEPEAIVRSSLRGIRIKEVPVVMSERMGGTSSINGMKSLYYMIKVSIAILTARVTI